MTFAELDRQKGFAEPLPATEEEYPLPAWYRAVREISLDQLGVEDVCKACRQQIHVEHVVPLALRLLLFEPLAGEMYDGELLASLKSVPADYWPTHADQAAILRAVCETIRKNDTIPSNVRGDVAELLTRTRFLV